MEVDVVAPMERTRQPSQPTRTCRTCVGCGQRGEGEAMVRLVLVPGPQEGATPASVVVDAKGGAFGRGAHVHPSKACFEKACRQGLSRAFKCAVKADAEALLLEVARAFARRLEGLLAGGVRGGHLVIGTDAVTQASQAGRLQLVLLAADATAAAERSAVKRATAEGKTLVYGDKRTLANALGKRHEAEERAGVGVCAVTDAALSASIRRAWICAVGLVPTRTDREDSDVARAEDE